MEAAADATIAGLSSRELLTVLIGDYWHRCTTPIPSAALVAMLDEFGVSPGNSRAALSRLARRGTLVVTKEGRRTFYSITDETAAWAMRRGRLLMRFGLDWPEWDGRWTCVAFSLPDDVNRSGPVLRARLRRLGLAQLYDGFWVSPHNRAAAVRALLDELAVVASTVLRADLADLPTRGRSPAEAWDLSSLGAGYLDFTAMLSDLAHGLDAGRVTEADSLLARTEVTVGWRAFAYDDPRLPRELLPADWPMDAARAAFVDVYDRLGPLAEGRARELVAPFSIPAGAQPRHHTVADGM